MKMSEEMAVRLHRMMWSDMQKELGDKCCNGRTAYKEDWLREHFPEEHFMHNCILCEYVTQQTGNRPLLGCADCKLCPIKWPGDNCSLSEREGGVYYLQSPISEILALPARNEKLTGFEAKYIAYDRAAAAEMYYEYRESLLSKASGIPASSSIGDHVKAIQEKAVEEYFANTPGAKLATMDVDEAFKQYADEQKAPIFKQLSKQSGLDRNRPVDDHIREIVKNSVEAGAAEERDRIQEKIYEVLLS